MQILKPGTRVPLTEEPNNPVAFVIGNVSQVSKAQELQRENGCPEGRMDETVEVRTESHGQVTTETIVYRRVGSGRIFREYRVVETEDPGAKKSS